jgi:hypothetical protein
MLVEFLGYSSPTYPDLPTRLPSQEYGFHLVRDFIARGIPIVVLLGERRWLDAVPERRDAGYVRARSPRASFVSPGNLGEETVERVVAAMAEA